MSEHAVVIAGGGPAGMMLAAELALARVDVAVVERRPDHLLVGSRGGGFHSRTIEVLDQRGVADRFLAAGQVAQAAMLATTVLDMSDFPTRHPYSLGIWQNQIERIMAAWIAELPVRIQATRRRMLDAAHALFGERGYVGTRMADVAADAGVAVQTVYFTFHTKAELFDACMARGVLGDADPLPPEEQPFYRAMRAADTGEAAIGHFVHGVCEIAARVSKLDRAVACALHEPDAAEFWERSESLRRAGFRRAAEHFDRFGLRMDVDRATDVLLSLAGHSVYCELVHDAGWPPDQFEEWLTDALTRVLLA